jgi:hypothetical protein
MAEGRDISLPGSEPYCILNNPSVGLQIDHRIKDDVLHSFPKNVSEGQEQAVVWEW